MAHAINALNIRAILTLVPDKDGASGADNLQLVVTAVRMEVLAELFCDKVDFLHLPEVLRDQLFSWEGSPFQSVVCLDVLDVGVRNVASEEVEILHRLDLLDSFRRLYSRIILGFEVRGLSIELLNFLNHCDEKTTRILVVGHDTKALGQLRQNALIVMIQEHGLFDLGA